MKAVLLLAVVACVAVHASADVADTLRMRLQAVVDAQFARYNMSFSVGVTTGGGETVTAVAGMKNYLKGERMDASARIPMGSATKLYTAVAALQGSPRRARWSPCQRGEGGWTEGRKEGGRAQ